MILHSPAHPLNSLVSCRHKSLLSICHLAGVAGEYADAQWRAAFSYVSKTEIICRLAVFAEAILVLSPHVAHLM